MVALALTAPSLLVFNTDALPSLYNQAVAIALWGVFVFSTPQSGGLTTRRVLFDPVGMVLLLLLTLVVLSVGETAFVVGSALVDCGVFVSAGVVYLAGMRTVSSNTRTWFAAFVVAALVNCLPAFVQAFDPAGPAGPWIAMPWSTDRISGNLRQPNLLATMCALGVAALGALLELSIVPVTIAVAGVCMLSLTLALTGSRIGFAEFAVLALAGLVQPSLRPATRRLMWLAPACVLACWGGLEAWSNDSGVLHARAPELASGRYGMWAQCLTLIATHPWLGVGFGNFNFAWTLTPFDRSNPETFDNAHNLVLQWAVEFGVPVTAVLLSLLGWSYWRCVRLARQATGADAVVRRFCLLIVALVLLHSLTEYPLWYAYFLLPTLFAWGLAAAPIRPQAAVPQRVGNAPTNWLGVAGLLMGLSAAFAVYDYQKIVTIWHPYDATPIEQRVAEGRTSILYGYLADRFAGTLAVNGTRTLDPYKTATRHLLDMRLLIAWSLAMRESGQLDKARYLAQRVKDFNTPVAQQFFDKCRQPRSAGELPWQCTPPTGHYSYKDFL